MTLLMMALMTSIVIAPFITLGMEGSTSSQGLPGE